MTEPIGQGHSDIAANPKLFQEYIPLESIRNIVRMDTQTGIISDSLFTGRSGERIAEILDDMAFAIHRQRLDRFRVGRSHPADDCHVGLELNRKLAGKLPEHFGTGP